MRDSKTAATSNEGAQSPARALTFSSKKSAITKESNNPSIDDNVYTKDFLIRLGFVHEGGCYSRTTQENGEKIIDIVTEACVA